MFDVLYFIVFYYYIKCLILFILGRVHITLKSSCLKCALLDFLSVLKEIQFFFKTVMQLREYTKIERSKERKQNKQKITKEDNEPSFVQ